MAASPRITAVTEFNASPEDGVDAPQRGTVTIEPPLRGLDESEALGFHRNYLSSHGEDAPADLLRVLVRSSGDVVVVLDDRAQLVYANPAAERTLGFRAANDVSPDIFELIHPDDREAAALAYLRDISQPGVHPPAVYRIMTATGAWRFLEIVATNCLDDPAINGVVLNARDVTTSENLFRALQTFGHANQVLVHAQDELQLLQDTCSTIVNSGGYAAAWVAYVEHDAVRTIRPVAASGNVGHLEQISISWADNDLGQGPAGAAVRTRSVQVVDDFRRSGAPTPSRRALERDGLRTCCVLPLEVGDEVIGVLAIFAMSPHVFDPPEVELFKELSAALAYGIGRLRDAVLLAVSEERFRSLASASPIGILEADRDGAVRYANPRICEIAGVAASELLGVGWLRSVHRGDRAALLNQIRTNREAGADLHATFRLVRPDGPIRHVRLSAASKAAMAGHEYVVTVEDATEEVVAHAELHRLAHFDPLTGLPNRTRFLERLRTSLAGCVPDSSKLAVLFLDLDRLKVVNDNFGHDAGDDVLRVVAQRLANALRSTETVARFGGDEFMFIMDGVESEHDAIGAAQRLLQALSEPLELRGQRIRVTGSVGIVIAGPGADAEEVLRDADTAMYRAKSSGRNRYALFDESLHRTLVERTAIEGDLRMAVARDELEVYYQPIVDLGTELPIGAEALVRWHRPGHGMVSPLEFIPIAEESGLIREIGAWVFERGLSQMASWDRTEGSPSLKTLSVNFSAHQLDDPDDIARIGAALRARDLDPARVEIEVTESVAMADTLLTRESLQALRDEGVSVSIDDFGTGYSSLAYLHTLPVGTVKIDRTFIERLPAGSGPVVRAILDMSHAMGMRVVAEGVSSADLKARASAMGCDLAQGFYWTKPLPAAEFASWWSKWPGSTTRWSATRRTLAEPSHPPLAARPYRVTAIVKRP